MTQLGAYETNTVYCCDLFELCDGLPDASVDMILCDLPYGTTACAWDTVIPFEPMWARFKRVIKPRGAIVLTASQPFTSALVMSNPRMFRYEWVWCKSVGTGGMNANKMPIKKHEQALVFYKELPTYNAQFTYGTPYTMRRNKPALGSVYGKTGVKNGFVSVNKGVRYPDSLLFVDNETGLHPTQKPVALFRYLIRTYTQPGELVVDPCVGSGTTAVAAAAEGRQYLCGDKEAGYVEIARARVAGRLDEYQAKQEGKPFTLSLFDEALL